MQQNENRHLEYTEISTDRKIVQYILERESQARRLDVVGISEAHWTGIGYFRIRTGNTIYFSGSDIESRNGVAFILAGPITKAILGYKVVNDCITAIKIRLRPVNINVIQVYAPTAESSEEEMEAFFDQFNATISELPRREILIVMGDMNAKIGQTTIIEDDLKQIIGSFGLGIRNELGDRMLQFCQKQNLTIVNTLFRHHNRRLYTWKSPGNRCRNQINYIMVGLR